MNSFYKYIISFLIGLIIYLFFKDNLLIEGSIQDIRNKLSNEQPMNRGCENYICKNDTNKYENYKLKPSSQNQNPYKDRCSNIPKSKYIYSNPKIIPCSNHICCRNYICSELINESDCGENIFLKNKSLTPALADEDSDTIIDICCQQPSINDFSALYDNILSNDDEGITGEEITGRDIKKYIYNTFLDINTMVRTESSFGSNEDRNELTLLSVDDGGDTEYNDVFYIALSNKISRLEYSEVDKLILKDDVITHLSSNPLNINEEIYSKYNIPLEDTPQNKVKKLLINLDKLIVNTNVNYKPLDRFFHTSLNQNNYKHIDKQMFIGILDQ